MTAYFPEISRGIPLKLRRISSEADVAVVAGNVSGLKLKLLTMDEDSKAAISGEPVVLIGYPTGIDAILARSSEDTLRSIAASTNGDLTGVMAELARRRLNQASQYPGTYRRCSQGQDRLRRPNDIRRLGWSIVQLRRQGDRGQCGNAPRLRRL